MTGLKDKVVIITGGTAGIGRAAALGLVKQGAKVITGRRAGPLKEAIPNIAGFAADVSERQSLGPWNRPSLGIEMAEQEASDPVL